MSSHVELRSEFWLNNSTYLNISFLLRFICTANIDCKHSKHDDGFIIGLIVALNSHSTLRQYNIAMNHCGQRWCASCKWYTFSFFQFHFRDTSQKPIQTSSSFPKHDKPWKRYGHQVVIGNDLHRRKFKVVVVLKKKLLLSPPGEEEKTQQPLSDLFVEY